MNQGDLWNQPLCWGWFAHPYVGICNIDYDTFFNNSQNNYALLKKKWTIKNIPGIFKIILTKSIFGLIIIFISLVVIVKKKQEFQSIDTLQEICTLTANFLAATPKSLLKIPL